jgi:hypothetical protein
VAFSALAVERGAEAVHPAAEAGWHALAAISAAIWEMTSSHDRVIFCPDYQAVTSSAEQRCGGCGTELFNVYRA